ncbi:MAG: alpha/beta hydrolase [Sphingomonas sp.]|nr:alpha/beta hydrolase [Sphingomonas sp.]
MPKRHVNGVDLYFEESGAADAPAILLIMGLGTQHIAWPEPFVAGLVAAGFRVIQYDNRDIGESSYLHGAPAVHPVMAIAATRFGLRFPLAYSVSDMAADALGLLDALGIDAAHIVGVSMGGMIAQRVAIMAPQRVLSLTSVMSSSGASGLPGPAPELRRRLTARRPARPDRAAAIAMGAEALAAIGHPDLQRETGAYEAIAARAFDRGYNPMGMRRQLLAIIADRGRADALGRITAPTLVIHGAADRLVPPANSEDIARRIPGARLEVIPDMAHDLPPSKVDRMVALITDHARRAAPIAKATAAA